MVLVFSNQPHQFLVQDLELEMEIWVVKQGRVQLPERFLMLVVRSGLAWTEVELHLHPAVVGDAWLVLGGEQILDQVGREVDTI